MNTKMVIAGLAACFIFGVNAGADTGTAEGSKNKAPFRLYKFGEAADNTVKNLAGDTGNLIFRDLKARKSEPFAEELRVVPGRRPGTKAVRIDQCSFIDAAYHNPETGAFSFTCWMKMRDYGKLQRGDKKSGMVAAVGGGYSGGWRIFVSGPPMNVTFQIGSKNPPGGSYLRAGILAPEAWQHVAVVWDGKQQRVYLNGTLSAEKEYAGDYANDGRLIIGYSGVGGGSLDMEIDEAAIYDKALTAEEIARIFKSQQ